MVIFPKVCSSILPRKERLVQKIRKYSISPLSEPQRRYISILKAWKKLFNIKLIQISFPNSFFTIEFSYLIPVSLSQSINSSITFMLDWVKTFIMANIETNRNPVTTNTAQRQFQKSIIWWPHLSTEILYGQTMNKDVKTMEMNKKIQIKKRACANIATSRWASLFRFCFITFQLL